MKSYLRPKVKFPTFDRSKLIKLSEEVQVPFSFWNTPLVAATRQLFWVSITFILSKVIQLRNYAHSLKLLALKEMKLPEDTDIFKLGAFHRAEFRRYRAIFDSKIRASEIHREPTELSIFRKQVMWSKSSTDRVIQIFKKMRREN